MKTIPSILILLLVAIGMSSCSDKNSLQNYILENAERVGFSSSTVPISSIKEQGMQMTEKQEEAFNAISRVNVLMFRASPENQDEFVTERDKVKNILKQKKYEELVDLGRNGVVKFTGEEEAIDEIIILLSNKEMGFAVTRIVGDDMNMKKFMELYQMVTQRDASKMNFNFGELTKFLPIN